ncbi:MAG: hypothetical protein MHM6MM_007427 [Cercozoa sp. M6MM]
MQLRGSLLCARSLRGQQRSLALRAKAASAKLGNETEDSVDKQRRLAETNSRFEQLAKNKRERLQRVLEGRSPYDHTEPPRREATHRCYPGHVKAKWLDDETGEVMTAAEVEEWTKQHRATLRLRDKPTKHPYAYLKAAKSRPWSAKVRFWFDGTNPLLDTLRGRTNIKGSAKVLWKTDLVKKDAQAGSGLLEVDDILDIKASLADTNGFRFAAASIDRVRENARNVKLPFWTKLFEQDYAPDLPHLQVSCVRPPNKNDTNDMEVQEIDLRKLVLREGRPMLVQFMYTNAAVMAAARTREIWREQLRPLGVPLVQVMVPPSPPLVSEAIRKNIARSVRTSLRTVVAGKSTHKYPLPREFKEPELAQVNSECLSNRKPWRARTLPVGLTSCVPC